MTADLVLDSSSLFHALADRGPVGDAVRARVSAGIHVPVLARYEVLNLLRRAELHGGLSADDAVLAADALARLTVTEWPLPQFARRIWALRRNVTTYDAAYVALAEWLDVPLLTQDLRLARASGPRCAVVVPGGVE